MKHISQDVADGSCCQLCNEFFITPDVPSEKKTYYSHGFPVVCEECWEDLLSEEQEQYTKADAPTLAVAF